MFILVDNRSVSSIQLKGLLEKLGNPYNDTDNLFIVKSIEMGNYTIATNGPIYDTSSNLKMVCKTRCKPEIVEQLYTELVKYSSFGDNIDAIKNIITTRCSNESFCIAAINTKGDYLVINDKSGMEQVYSGSMGSNTDASIYSTYHITTYFKDCINIVTVKPINCDNITMCLSGTITTIIANQEVKVVSTAGQVGKGVMGGDLMNGGNNFGMDSIFGPLVGNNTDKLSSIENDMKPNKNGVSVFDKIVQWSTVQSFLGSDTTNDPKSTNVFYNSNFFNHHPPKNYETVIQVLSEDWIDKALEMKSRNINSVILNMTDKVFPAVDIHLGIGGQEESIFRRSNLNRALLLDKFYPFNNDNRVIYSNDVTIYYGGEKVKWEQLEKPHKVSIISCPPVKSPYNLEYDYTKLFENSKMSLGHIITTKGYLQNTLQAAIKNGHDGIVLPAFGCEGQKNPPRCVAEILGELLETYSGFFKEIIICIPDADDKLLGNYNIFKEVLEKKVKSSENTTEVQLDNILEQMI